MEVVCTSTSLTAGGTNITPTPRQVKIRSGEGYGGERRDVRHTRGSCIIKWNDGVAGEMAARLQVRGRGPNPGGIKRKRVYRVCGAWRQIF